MSDWVIQTDLVNIGCISDIVFKNRCFPSYSVSSEDGFRAGSFLLMEVDAMWLGAMVSVFCITICPSKRQALQVKKVHSDKTGRERLLRVVTSMKGVGKMMSFLEKGKGILCSYEFRIGYHYELVCICSANSPHPVPNQLQISSRFQLYAIPPSPA